MVMATVTKFWTIGHTVAIVLTVQTIAFPANKSTSTQNHRLVEPSGFDSSCFDSLGNPYTDIVPNPWDCGEFSMCTPIFADEPFKPSPIPRPCPPGLGLCFDMIKCQCEYCSDPATVCFDADNPEHQQDKFRLKCACPMHGETDSEFCQYNAVGT